MREPELDITFEQIRSLIEKLSEETKKGFTTREMMLATGYNVKWCRNKIRTLIDNGQAECIGTDYRTGIDGQRHRVPVYRLVKKQ
jgi:hypothetical protein